MALKRRPAVGSNGVTDVDVGLFAPLVALVDDEPASILGAMVGGAIDSTVLPSRTVGWIFAVVATALDCTICRDAARQLLIDEGIDSQRIDAVVRSMSSGELDETEQLVLPWVRETVHYRTEVIQRRTKELSGHLDAALLLEVIGVSSLANACARLSLLRQ